MEPLGGKTRAGSSMVKSRQPLDEKFDVVFTGLNYALTVCMSGYKIMKQNNCFLTK